MDRQVIEIYDRMAMPDGCARSIEEEMQQVVRQKKGGNHMKEKKKVQKQGWCMAVLLVILVLAVSVGGVFLFLRMSRSETASAAQEKAAQPAASEIPPAESAAESGFVLTDQGKAFLEKMCYYMPDWSDGHTPDDTFWRDFLFNSFTCPEITADGAAMTVCGEQELVATSWGQAVKVSRDEAVIPYVLLATGLEMPDFAPSARDMSAGQTLFYYEDGCYYIGLSDFGDVGYVFRGCYPNEQSPDKGASVIFDAYSGAPEDTIGSVCFSLVPENNENGFIITQKAFRYDG